MQRRSTVLLQKTEYIAIGAVQDLGFLVQKFDLLLYQIDLIFQLGYKLRSLAFLCFQASLLLAKP